MWACTGRSSCLSHEHNATVRGTKLVTPQCVRLFLFRPPLYLRPSFSCPVDSGMRSLSRSHSLSLPPAPLCDLPTRDRIDMSVGESSRSMEFSESLWKKFIRPPNTASAELVAGSISWQGHHCRKEREQRKREGDLGYGVLSSFKGGKGTRSKFPLALPSLGCSLPHITATTTSDC